MHDAPVYLKDEAYFEPLFNHWYASLLLLAPVTAARCLSTTHRRLMTSFINNAELHQISANDPKLAGGDFLNCSADRVLEIRRLLEELDNRCADLVGLAEAVKQLDELMRGHTSGESVDRLYAQTPDALKGYVELVLDLEHHPAYRLLEPLLYRSRFYRRDLQSASFGLLSRVNERPFVLSTPRLADERHMQVQVDFNAPILDVLFRARCEPTSAREIIQGLASLPRTGGLRAEELLTPTLNGPRHRPVKSGVRLTYIGHAGFLIETQDVSILVDPVIASRNPSRPDDVVSFSELPGHIDYICLTHGHQDHANIETLLQLRHKTRTVLVPRNNAGTLADPSLRLLLKQLDFNVVDLDEFDCVACPDGSITSIPFFGEHGDLHIRAKTAWLIELNGRKLFFGSDSSNPDTELYRHIHEIVGEIDVLFIGMECVGAPFTWLYGPLFTRTVPKTIRDSRRLNGSDFQQADQIVRALRPREVYVYALGLEPWYRYFMGIQYGKDSKQILESNQLVEACRSRGIPSEALCGKRTFELGVT